ncbi:MAG: ATP-dependent Clp protease adaptor ClpS [Flavobacteriales bacterium]|nr:ATP-dependent Clp protease adaptor ClpS [Flavobacteriales bacterium]
MSETKTLEKVETKVQEEHLKALLVHNDDVHTFDYVIESLVDICGHTEIQATQCTYIIHYKGKCDVKRGSFDDLLAPYNELIGKGLSAEIVD